MRDASTRHDSSTACDSPIVEIRDVSLWRGSRRILSNINWTIDHGRHWALIGANGAGKTSLLRIMTGYLWPSEGQVAVMGQVYGEVNLPELRKSIGWVSSSLQTQLAGNLAARDVVISGLDAALNIYRTYTAKEYLMAEHALTRLGIVHLSEQSYGTLSQGEQQRVLLARGLVHQPHLLILDEPCAGLDPAARFHLLDDIEHMSAQPDAPTILLVTHHIEEIGPWITDVAVMKNGGFLAAGKPDQVLTGALLSDAFDYACSVTHVGRGFALSPNAARQTTPDRNHPPACQHS